MDANANANRTHRYLVGRATPDPGDEHTMYSFFGDDRPKAQSITDTGGVPLTTEWDYDPVGNTTATRTPSSTAARDALAAGTAPPDAANQVGVAQTATFTHDNLVATESRLVDPNGGGTRTTTYLYDSAGRKTAQTVTGPVAGNPTASGGTQSFDWFPNDRLASENGRQGETIEYTYTADGLTATITGSGSTITADWYLDGMSRTVDDGRGRTQGYAYDGAGQITARLDDGQTTSYSRNDAGLPVSWASSLAGTTTNTWTVTGLPATQSNPNGTSIDWTFEDDYDLATQVLERGSITIAKWAYSHDGLRRVTSQDFAGETAGTAFPAGFTNTYSYTYTPAGRLATFNDGTTTKNLTWDRDGNRLTYGTDTYTYRADGSINAANGSGFTYDAVGRTITDGDSCYQYDGLDRRIAFTKDSTTVPCDVDMANATTTYVYDPLGRQAAHTAPDATDRQPVDIHYDGLGNQIVAENGAGTGEHDGDATYILDAAGTPSALWSHPNEGGTRLERLEYLTGDGNGSITTVTTDTGNADCAARFDPYGNPINPSGAAAGNGVCASVPTGTAPATVNDHWYQTGRQDASSGQCDFGARTYDPSTASWLTPDTYRTGDPGQNLSVGTDPLTANTYRYVNGDPINANDPTGHRLEECANGTLKAALRI